MCNIQPSVLNNDTLQALVCAGLITECGAICPNPDLAGIGVRVAFYLQSALNGEHPIYDDFDTPSNLLQLS